MHRTIGKLIAGLGLLTLSGSIAEAGGFATARFGGNHGHVTTDHPTAIYYNPAGLALGKGTRVFAEGVFAYRSASYERPEGAINNVADGESGTPTNATDANSGEASLGNFVTSPFLGVVSDLGVPNLGVSVAAYAPFGGQATWDKNNDYKDSASFPGAVDGVQRWSTMEGQIRALYLSAAGAYYLPGPRLSFGASVNVVSQAVNTLRARTASGTDDLVSSDGNLLEGRSLVDVSGTTVSLGIGVLWQATDSLHLGLSYQSQPGFGETQLGGTLQSKFGNGAAETTKINLSQSLPDIVRVGGRFRAQDNLELRLSVDYTRWSVFDKQCLTDATNGNANCELDSNGGATTNTEAVIVNLQRDWKDTFGVRLGASYWLNDKAELAGNFTYDSSAVPDESIDPALMDMNKLVATIGGRLEVMKNLLVNLNYTHAFYFERNVDVRARDGMGNEIGFDAPSVTPDHGGRYSQMIGLINLGLEYAF